MASAKKKTTGPVARPRLPVFRQLNADERPTRVGEDKAPFNAEPKPQSYKTTDDAQKAFLAAFARTGVIQAACDASGVGRTTHYLWMHDDPTYPPRFAHAQEQSTDMLVTEAVRRAVYGYVDRITYDKDGNETHHVAHSDRLLEVLMKGHRPEVYADKVKTELTGKDGKPIALEGTIDVTDKLSGALAALVASGAARVAEDDEPEAEMDEVHPTQPA